MNQKLLIRLGVMVLLAVVIVGAAYIVTHKSTKPSGSSSPMAATFFCSNNAKIDATFATSSVALTLSDGRSLTLPHAISASGARYEATTTGADIVFWNKGDNAFVTENGKTTYDNCTAAQVLLSDAPGYETYTDQAQSFSFALPTNFSIAGSAVGYTQDWSVGATTNGMILAHIEVPRSYEPGTNFGNARFTVGTSADPAAVAACLTSPFQNTRAQSTQVMIGTVPFTKLILSDAAAGNRYDTTSYRTVRDGQCYAVEYTIHYSNFDNYPPGMVQQFDEAKVQAALEELVQTFHFLR